MHVLTMLPNILTYISRLGMEEREFPFIISSSLNASIVYPIGEQVVAVGYYSVIAVLAIVGELFNIAAQLPVGLFQPKFLDIVLDFTIAVSLIQLT